MFPDPHYIKSNGINMAVYEQGEGPPVVLLHGFPELAYTWRHQLPALAEAGFHAIAPDQRGYGQTDVPPNVEDYNADELIADVHGLLDALGLETATFVGHDWGALLLWYMAVLAPERIDRLVILNIPHSPRPPIDPIEIFRERMGDDFYIVNFQDSDQADHAFAADPAHFFDMMMRRNQITREQFDQLPPKMKSLSLLEVMAREKAGGEPLLTDEERDYFANAFTHSGFTGPINWYRNWTRNWERLDGIDHTIDIPTLFIGADNDVIISPEFIERMNSGEMMAREKAGGEPLLTDEERDYFANAFTHSGFTGPINWYRNWTRNWERLDGIDHTIDIPTLFIGADNDVIISPEFIERMKPLMTNLDMHMLEACGHWSQQEQPRQVNKLIVDWLEKKF